MNYVNGIPLWNTALLPVLYVVSGLLGGAEIVLGINVAGGEISSGIAIEEWIRILLMGYVILIPIYLLSTRYTSVTGQASVRKMLLGKWSPVFWIVAVLVGMGVPAAAVVSSYVMGLEATPGVLLYIAIFSGLIGDLAVRNLILRCGLYSPLIPSSSTQTIPARS